MNTIISIILIYIFLGIVYGIYYELNIRKLYYKYLKPGEFNDNILVQVLLWPLAVTGIILGYIDAYFRKK